jgi:hypothetical protein
MTEAETILKLIESVDPKDTAKLDEIDARVWCYLHYERFGSIGRHNEPIGYFLELEKQNLAWA